MTHMLIDTDVHVPIPSFEALRPYLPGHVTDYCAFTGYLGPDDAWYPRGAASLTRADWTDNGGVEDLRRELLDPFDITVAILNCAYPADGVMNPDFSAAFARAANDWLAEEWLSRDPRLRGSLIVPNDVDFAVAEIEHRAGDERFVQVIVPVRTQMPIGRRTYHPLWRAAAEHGLPVALCFGGSAPGPPTGTGFPSLYLEEYVGMAEVCQTQLMSIISGGVLDLYPSTRIVCVECGWAWLPPVTWRMDKEWKGMRREIPWVDRLPSDYVRQHVRLTLQPIDAPTTDDFVKTIAQMGSDDMVLFSTDYPHARFRAGEPPMPADVPEALATKIRATNAIALYGASRLGVRELTATLEQEAS